MQLNDKASVTKTAVNYISYSETGFFSNIVLDYLKGEEKLSSFYKHRPDIDGIKKSLEDRRQYPYDRTSLVSVLTQQYQRVDLKDQVRRNLDLLSKRNTFTITTAHQPNVFTGPLYFIYKIVHAIKLAAYLNEVLSEYNFVPVYYMGSEDADLDELGHFSVNGHNYEWKTNQTGAVGRMIVDKPFLQLIAALDGQLSVLPHGSEIIALFQSAYQEGKTLQQCTFNLVNSLFGDYGLIVLMPDEAALKQIFIPVAQKELEEQFSHKAVSATVKELEKVYKVQAGGRDLNLFYLVDDKRERIEIGKEGYFVSALNKSWTREAVLSELHLHPDRFSPNVILRGVFQEMILPNVAFIGGGGEIAYWLELKQVFDTANVPFPVLVLRNSFLLAYEKQIEQMAALGFAVNQIFQSAEQLLNQYTKRETVNQVSLSEEAGALNLFYQQLHATASRIDSTLANHVSALQMKALKKIQELEKKMLRSEKRKFAAEKRRIEKIKGSLFPNDSLQERVENMSGFYAREGKQLIDVIYEHSLALEQQFGIVTL